MNQTIKTMLERRSIRSFTDETISEEDLDLIIKVAQRAPSSINGQQSSLVITKDKAKIKAISEICGQTHIGTAQIFITVITDYRKAIAAGKINNKPINVVNTASGLLIGAIDAGIVVEAISTAAEALNIGNTIIRSFSHNDSLWDLIKLLELPENTFPMVGITLGITNQTKKPELRPRLNLKTFVNNEKYENIDLEKYIKEYDVQMETYNKARNLDYTHNYSISISNKYSQVDDGPISRILTKQNFKG